MVPKVMVFPLVEREDSGLLPNALEGSGSISLNILVSLGNSSQIVIYDFIHIYFEHV